MKKFNLTINKCEDIRYYLQKLREYQETRQKDDRNYFDEIESEVEEKLKFLNDLTNNYDNLISKQNELIEYKYVLAHADQVLGIKNNSMGFGGPELVQKASFDLGQGYS